MLGEPGSFLVQEQLAADAAVLDRAARWLGPVDIRSDRSWPHGESRVLEICAGTDCSILKWHRSPRGYSRELAALERYTPALRTDSAQLIASADDLLALLITRVPGEIAAGTEHAHSADAHTQAGALLRRLHEADAPVVNTEFGPALLARFEHWAQRAEGRVDVDDLLSAERIALAALDLPPLELVPAHRDFGPRNWVVDPSGRVRLIDFAAVEYEPWCVDLFRLSQGEWLDQPELERAFLDGYGREPDALDTEVLRAFHAVAAVSTIVWALDHGDLPFAQHGREMLERLLGRTLY